MAVVVLSRTRQSLSRRLLGSSLAGDGILVRMRSTTIGLLGLVTVVGLGLVAFISQIGWPGVFSGPLPQAPASGVVHNDTIALARAETYPSLPARVVAGRSLRAKASRRQEVPSSAEPDVAGADQLTEAPAEPPAPPGPGPAVPPSQTAPVPISQPTGQEPPASPPASGDEEDGAEAPAPVAAGSGGKSRGHGKGKGHERDDRRGGSSDRHEDRRGGSDDNVSEGSSPSPIEDRWGGEDADSDGDDWADDHGDDRDHNDDDWHRGKSDGRHD